MENSNKETWYYETNADNTARYVLGTHGKNPLLILSVNPSYGSPEVDTPTLGTVRHITEHYGYDSWIIMCLYPQRAVHTSDLAYEPNEEWIEDNLKVIDVIMQSHPDSPLWACWGTLINDRPYLWNCLTQIVPIAEKYHEKWLHYGPLTEHGDPHYDLYLEDDEGFYPFDINQYIQDHFDD